MDRMNTLRNRPNYFLLNDGLDEEASPEDRLDCYENVTTLETISFRQNQYHKSSSFTLNRWQRYRNLSGMPEFRNLIPLRGHGHTLKYPEFENPWIVKKSNKRKLIDRVIRCAVLDNETGEKCGWKTTDSQPQASTGNMIDHLRKLHSIDSPNKLEEPKKAESSILSCIKGKERLTHQQLLEKNILRWIVAEKQPFTTLESPAFQQIIHDIPGIRLPFTSRQVVRHRLADDFAAQRVQLNEELSITCKTTAISLDVWTSKNSLPILGIIGHWFTSEFQYQQRASDFRELHGSHSGENLAAAVQATLEELHLERKLIAITGDNASNNKKMISVLYENLQKKSRFFSQVSGVGELCPLSSTYPESDRQRHSIRFEIGDRS